MTNPDTALHDIIARMRSADSRWQIAPAGGVVLADHVDAWADELEAILPAAADTALRDALQRIVELCRATHPSAAIIAIGQMAGDALATPPAAPERCVWLRTTSLFAPSCADGTMLFSREEMEQWKHCPYWGKPLSLGGRDGDS